MSLVQWSKQKKCKDCGKILKENRANFCRSCSKKGKRNPMFGRQALNFKGGTKNKDGYRLYSKKMNGTWKLVYAHRFIMEQFLGRKLKRNEIIHHKDGNKLNNEISNLEIMTQVQHLNLHKPALKYKCNNFRNKNGRFIKNKK
jgi:hypothetical protein